MGAGGGSMTGYGGFHSLNSASVLSTSGWPPASPEEVLQPEQEAKQTKFPRFRVRGSVLCDPQTRVLAPPCLTGALR